MHEIGKLLVVLGLVLVGVGIVVMLAGRLPWFGRLPGDLYIQRGNWSFYFPLATSLVLSIVLSLMLYLISRR